ncbi:helix-turn-helix transcriptional regulator [Streptomonospora sediminis]
MAASPTLRRRRLSRHLDHLRTKTGLTAAEVAKRAKKLRPDRPWSAAKVVRVENREWKRLWSDDVLTLLDIYEVTDKAQRDAYVRLALEASQTGWWVGYKDILGNGAYVDLETEASRIRTYQALVVPGLLQTEGYARAVIMGDTVTDEREIARRFEARMMRQQVLARSDGPRLHAILDEGVFRKLPADVAAEQIRHLIEVQQPSGRVQVQVLPDSVGPHPGMAGSFVILDFPSDPSTVYLEHAMSGLFPEDPIELEHYATIHDHLQASALPVDESAAFMERMLTDR